MLPCPLSLSLPLLRTHASHQRWPCSRLKLLDLSHNSLTGPLPGEWLAARTAATSGGPRHQQAAAARCLPLETLVLSYNRLSGRLPPGLLAPSAFCALQVLYLDSNALHGPLPPEWLLEHIDAETGLARRYGAQPPRLPAAVAGKRVACVTAAIN